MFFKLIGGRHRQRSVVYSKGDIIESDTDLVKAFKNKFVRMYELERPEDSVVEKPGKPNIPSNKSSEGKGEKDCPESPEPDEDEVVDEDDVDEDDVDEDDEDDELEEARLSKYGSNITSSYSDAEEFGLRVYQNAQKWVTVVDVNEDKVLNKRKLRPAQVEAFLDQCMED